jgi:hypothetical protein
MGEFGDFDYGIKEICASKAKVDKESNAGIKSILYFISSREIPDRGNEIPRMRCSMKFSDDLATGGRIKVEFSDGLAVFGLI